MILDKKERSWKVYLAVVAIIVPAVGNYLSARFEADEARVRAEVSYETLQEAVKELQNAVRSQELALATLNGRILTQEEKTSEAQKSPPPVIQKKPKTHKKSSGIGVIIMKEASHTLSNPEDAQAVSESIGVTSEEEGPPPARAGREPFTELPTLQEALNRRR